MKKILLAILCIFSCIYAAYAVPALNRPITVTQPDGTVLTIRIHGDEFLHWTTCGNFLVAKASDGYWRYASFDSEGVSKALGERVRIDLPGDGKGIRPPKSAIDKAREKRERLTGLKKKASKRTAARMSPISEGTKRFLILLIEFSDKNFTKQKSNFEDMLNSTSYSYNGATGSVNKYYQDVSFGKFNPVFDVFGPIRVSYTSAYCANNPLNAVIEACNYAHNKLGVNFANYCNLNSSDVDNVFFFFPGYNQAEGGGSDTIWPHAAEYYSPFLVLDGKNLYKYGCASEFKGNSGGIMAGIGTFSHEFGHVIGLPDFYDTDYEENGYGNGLYTLSLMDTGSYNNNGNTPPYFTYEEKHMLGWDNGLTPLKQGTNTINKTSNNVTFYNPTQTEGEYYLYESRPNTGWDKYTECSGLAIYHVDKSDFMMPNGLTARELWEINYYINDFAEHQCMDLVESVYPESALKYYSQLVFPGYNNVTKFTSETKPSSRSWAGADTGYNITNISFNNLMGTTTLTVETAKGISGEVKSTSNEPIAGADVTIRFASSVASKEASSNGLTIQKVYSASLNSTEQYRATTDAQGKFEIKLEKDGIYEVSVSKDGYLDYHSNVEVKAITNLNIILNTISDEAGITLQKYTTLSNYIIGYGANTDHYVGLRYTAQELAQYVGDPINSITFMAYNNGTGTVDKMGVQVYFDSTLMCDCETEHIFGTFCRADISRYNLKIPSAKTVTFVYYLINPTYGYPVCLADDDKPVTGANLISNKPNLSWTALDYGNVVISASITHNATVIDLSGINYIIHKSSYNSGEKFDLKLQTSSVNPPSAVSWTVNGEPATGSVVLQKGVSTIRAYLTFSSGRHEVIETKLNVK